MMNNFLTRVVRRKIMNENSKNSNKVNNYIISNDDIAKQNKDDKDSKPMG